MMGKKLKQIIKNTLTIFLKPPCEEERTNNEK
jgi:hypothetical protein